MKRGEVTQKQPNLFKPTSADTPIWKPVLERSKLDLIFKNKVSKGEQTFTKTYNSFTCLICRQSTQNSLYVKNSYCFNCNILHEADYDK